jgi:hypothetical protein
MEQGVTTDILGIVTETARMVDAMTETTRMADSARAFMAAVQTGAVGMMVDIAAEREKWLKPIWQEYERRTSAAIRALGGDPKAAAWDEWDLEDLYDAAAMAKHLRARYGARLSVEPRAVAGAKRGRSSVWTKGKLDRLFQMLAKGANRAQCATALEVSESSITRAMKKHNLKF